MKASLSLLAEKISYSYSNLSVFSDISFSVTKGSKILLLGSNGAGKTTLLKLLSGIYSLDSGSICYSDNKKISFLGHQLQLYMNLTVIENLSFFASLNNVKNEIEEVVSYWKLSEIINKKINNLSKGQKQRVALAISLINKPNYIFLDEPTSNLDDLSLKLLFDYISFLYDFHEGNVISIVASHDLNRLSTWANSLIIMGDNKFIFEKDLTDYPENFIKTKYLEVVR